MVYHPLSRLVPLFIQQRYDTNPAVRSTGSQKIYLLCLSGVEWLLSEAQKPLNDPVTNLQLRKTHPSGVHRTGRAMSSDGSDGAEDTCSLLENPPNIGRSRRGRRLHPSGVPLTDLPRLPIPQERGFLAGSGAHLSAYSPDLFDHPARTLKCKNGGPLFDISRNWYHFLSPNNIILSSFAC